MTTPEINGTQPNKGNCLLRGCLIVLLVLFLTFCCAFSVVALSFTTDFDPLGIKNRIGNTIPWEDFLDDPSQIPDLNELFDSFLEEDLPLITTTPREQLPTIPQGDAWTHPLETYIATDFPAEFSYPAGWEIEVEPYRVSFYDPDTYTLLYVGEDEIGPGFTAFQLSDDVRDSMQSDAEEGTFRIIQNESWSVPTGDDAHLNSAEWTDLEGYNVWAYDLEIVYDEYNVFFILIGEDPEHFATFGDLMEVIAASYRR